jgi:small-conductance mechanosensitive channel
LADFRVSKAGPRRHRLASARRSACSRTRSPWLWLALCLGLGIVSTAVGAQENAAPVRVGDSVVFSLSVPRDGQTPAVRAQKAAAALALVAQEPEVPEVRVERGPSSATIFAGSTIVVELEDVDAAGTSSLDEYANATAARVRQALTSEHKRSRVAETVFSFSLVVFFALIAFYLIKKVASLAERLGTWLDEHGDKFLRISIKNIELVRPAVLRSTAAILLGLGKWLGQFGIFYAWLLVVLSLFDATRDYTERLTGFVLSPLSLLMGRAAAALPLLIVAGFAALSVFILVRFTGLFLASVARRETALAWLPADLAAPASVLLRIAMVIAALVFAAPIVTGSSDGSLARTGAIVLIALGLAATPLFASVLLGAVMLFGRRLGVGEYVRIRDKLGRVTAINLLELRLQTSDGTEQRYPHLSLLLNAIERLGASPRLSVEVLVAPGVAPIRALQVLAAAGDRVGRDSSSEIVSIEPAGTRYRVIATLPSLAGRSLLLQGALEALDDAGIRMG